MTEFKIGDIVRLTKGEPDRPGYRVEVRSITEGISESPEVNSRLLRTFENAGWTVELIERPLPTTPNTLGWATVAGRRCLVRLGVFGQWEVYNGDGALVIKPHPSTIKDFTGAVLIPKELADEITAWAGGGSVDADRLLGDLAAHLKGQDDE